MFSDCRAQRESTNCSRADARQTPRPDLASNELGGQEVDAHTISAAARATRRSVTTVTDAAEEDVGVFVVQAE
jgi:hypothetical protein